MWTDPIVEEIRREREAYAAQFSYDLEAIYQDIVRQQQESGRTLAAPPTTRLAAGTEYKQLQTAQGG